MTVNSVSDRQAGRKMRCKLTFASTEPIREDFYDGLVSERRRKEKGASFSSVKADLAKRGRLRG